MLIVNAVVFQRTLLQDRYLSFSSAHWLVLVGVSLTVHVGAFYRGLLVAPFLIAGVLSLAESIRIRADAVDSRELACEWVKDVDPAGQLILVLEPKDVNLVKYYLSKRKVSNLRVAWLRQIGMRRGHVIHVASFAEGDVLGHDELTDFDSIWCVRSDDGGVPFANFAVHRQRSFQGSWTAKCTAVELRRLK